MSTEWFRLSNFTGGELDPQMLGRKDLKQYFASVASAQNMLFQPQGPMNRRPGLAVVGFIRNPLLAVTIPGEGLTMPNGGTAADLLDTSGPTTTTTEMEAVDPYVVLEIDFGEPTTLSCLDLIDYAAVPDGDSTGAGATPTAPFPGGFNPGIIDIDAGQLP